MLYSCIPIWQQSASKGWLLCGCSLATPGLRYIGPICIRFTYHMLGGGVGSLLVYTRFHGGPSNPLFNQTGQHCWCTRRSTEDLQTRSSTRQVSSAGVQEVPRRTFKPALQPDRSALLVYRRFHGGPSNPLFNKTDQLCWCTGGSTEDLQTRSSTRRVSSVTAGSKQPLMQYSSTPKVYVASSTSLILNICNRCYLSDQVPETLTRT